jgi:hypothetical protein
MNFSYLNPENNHAYIRSVFRFRVPLFIIVTVTIFSSLLLFLEDRNIPHISTQLGILLIIGLWVYGFVGIFKISKLKCETCESKLRIVANKYGDVDDRKMWFFYLYGTCMHCGACDIEYPKQELDQ